MVTRLKLTLPVVMCLNNQFIIKYSNKQGEIVM